MKKTKKWIFLSSLFIVHNSFAMFCPTNFNQINMGDSIDVVAKLCGKPDTQKTYKTDSNAPQEWSYYIKLKPSDTGTLKMSVAFVNNQVVNINVNAIGLTNTKICPGGRPIQAGDSMKTVETACGKPAFIQQTTPGSKEDLSSAKSVEMVEFTYSTSPPIVLVFSNGKLSERK